MAKPESKGPLAGLRVVELGTLIAGPFCGQLLGDMGAEVIKVEAPGVGDPMRSWGRGLPVWWPVIGRNKKSVTLNLRDERGQDILRQLVQRADVVVENFRPGTLEKWGLGYEQLAAVNPRLVMARVSGFGQSGPYSSRAGYGSIGEAMGGIRYLAGDPDRPPSRVGLSIGDSLAATFACVGTLAALHERERSGRGQMVDSAIYEAVLAVMESTIPEYAEGGAFLVVADAGVHDDAALAGVQHQCGDAHYQVALRVHEVRVHPRIGEAGVPGRIRQDEARPAGDFHLHHPRDAHVAHIPDLVHGAPLLVGSTYESHSHWQARATPHGPRCLSE